MDSICFDKSTFYTYVFLLACIIIFLIYITTTKPIVSEKLSMDDNELYKTILRLKDEINDCKNAQKEKTDDLYSRTSYKISSPTQQRFIDNMNNPLIGPEIAYPGGSFTEPGYDAYENYQKLGFISNATGQFPIYGRQKYPRSDKMEYYTINEGRNSVKIPLKTTNYTELYDKDPINIPELGGDSIFTKYENQGNRYNPNIF